MKECTSSRGERVQRGLAYRSLFLTGSEDGTPQTFLRTQDMIRDLLAFIFSPSPISASP